VVQATFSVKLGTATDCGANRALAGSGAITKSAPTRASAPIAKYFKLILLNYQMAAYTERAVVRWKVWYERMVNRSLNLSIAA
jgi:hypothetical protein